MLLWVVVVVIGRIQINEYSNWAKLRSADALIDESLDRKSGCSTSMETTTGYRRALIGEFVGTVHGSFAITR